MTMTLTVLGRYSPFPPAGGACPGYWVGNDATGDGILLDCGPGVLARFQERVGPLSRAGTVVLSHLHFDHTADFHALRYAVSPDRPRPSLPARIAVYAPPEPATEFSLLKYKDAVVATAVAPGDSIRLGEFRVTFFRGEHAIPTHAMRIEGSGGIIAYSGDSRPCPGLEQAASGADLFLCEASAIEADARHASAGHLTARQAGELAARIGVNKLVLTHLWPMYDPEEILRECRSAFPQAELAEEGKSYPLSRDSR